MRVGHLNNFSGQGGGDLNKSVPKIQIPWGLPGGILKLRFDWYIKTRNTQRKEVNMTEPYQTIATKQRKTSQVFTLRKTQAHVYLASKHVNHNEDLTYYFGRESHQGPSKPVAAEMDRLFDISWTLQVASHPQSLSPIQNEDHNCQYS